MNDGTEQGVVVDVIEQNYYLEVIYNNNYIKEFYLWLLDAEGGKGSFMVVEDTHTIYNFSKGLKDPLIDLFDSVIFYS